jgi:predicted AAA+ superfamily ATPase
MLTALVGADSQRIANDPRLTGMVFETFVVMELVKLASWTDATVRVFHYRDHDQREVDVVLERADGDLIGLEVKARATVTSSDFRSLSYLRDKNGSRFRLGSVLYTGPLSLPFGDRLKALPISCLWS